MEAHSTDPLAKMSNNVEPYPSKSEAHSIIIYGYGLTHLIGLRDVLLNEFGEIALGILILF